MLKSNYIKAVRASSFSAANCRAGVAFKHPFLAAICEAGMFLIIENIGA